MVARAAGAGSAQQHRAARLAPRQRRRSTKAVRARTARFDVQEATIDQIQRAILNHQLTTVQLVNLYLDRIKAYNGTCVDQPAGILGPVTPIANAGQVNALMTLNLRPAKRTAWGFDDRKARSMTDSADDSPAMPDALEAAAQLDRRFAQTGKLAGPLHRRSTSS